MQMAAMNQVKATYVTIRAEQKRLLDRFNTPHSGTGVLSGINPGTRFSLHAWERAKLLVEFETEVDKGNVRLRTIADSDWSEEDLFGDVYNPEVNDNIKPHIIERELQAERRRVDSEGVWGLVGEYFDGETWRDVDSCWGFIGDDWRGSDVDEDIMRSTLEAAHSARLCECCNRPILQS